MVSTTTAQKASAPTPGWIVIAAPKVTSAPSSDSIKMSIIDQRPIKHTMHPPARSDLRQIDTLPAST